MMVVLKDAIVKIWKRRLQIWLIIKKNDDNSYGDKKDQNDENCFFSYREWWWIGKSSDGGT